MESIHLHLKYMGGKQSAALFAWRSRILSVWKHLRNIIDEVSDWSYFELITWAQNIAFLHLTFLKNAPVALSRILFNKFAKYHFCCNTFRLYGHHSLTLVKFKYYLILAVTVYYYSKGWQYFNLAGNLQSGITLCTRSKQLSIPTKSYRHWTQFN